MTSSSLAYFNLHSHFSLLRATPSIDELIGRAVQDGIDCLALTDDNSLYGAVRFSVACREAGIKPILGMEVAVGGVPGSTIGDRRGSGKAVLLAKDQAGYRSLCSLSAWLLRDPELSSADNLVLPWDILRNLRAGLIYLDGGAAGWTLRLLAAVDPKAASVYLGSLSGTFEDDFYQGLDPFSFTSEGTVKEAWELANRFGVKAAPFHPVRYLEEKEESLLRLMNAIRENKALALVPVRTPEADHSLAEDQGWPDVHQFRDAIERIPGLVEGMKRIIASCELNITAGDALWPVIHHEGGRSSEQVIRQRVQSGLSRITGGEGGEAYSYRLERELEVITGRGYSSFFLMVQEVAAFARRQDIPMSTRGSVANSLVAYVLGITDIDPIKHDLLFERFLNPARKDLPDIDLDFCSRRREEVLRFLRSRYGEDRTALISTINTFKLRSALREAAKAHGLVGNRLDRLVDKFPPSWRSPRGGFNKTISQGVREKLEPGEVQILESARGLIGKARHLSIHPGGVVLTPGPLNDYLPTQRAQNGFLITQFDHEDVARLGLPKMDLLGIRALTVLSDGADLVREHYQPDFNLEGIRPPDTLTAETLTRGDTIGVFQCDSLGAQRTLRKLRAADIEDMAIANAFFKPGPAMGGMAEEFVSRYRGDRPVNYLHPALEPILASTYGVLIFQEQVLRVAREIAGLSWEDADRLRKGISRFGAEVLEELRDKFLKGCGRRDLPGGSLSADQSSRLWEQVRAFSGYGFNKGHALAYANISYRMAYIKAHWPSAFLCARLANPGGYHHPAVYMAEAFRKAVPVRPPHVNLSGSSLGLEMGEHGPCLRLGLGWVKELRRSSIRDLVKERQYRPFASIQDLLERVEFHSPEIENLVRSGGCDGLAPHRSHALHQVASAMEAGSPRQHWLPSFERPEPASESDADRLRWEREILGMPVSVFPHQVVRIDRSDQTPLRDLPKVGAGVHWILGSRLPGRTGGKGYYLFDGSDFILVRVDPESKGFRSRPKSWDAVMLSGRWVQDRWGGSWFDPESQEVLPIP